MSPRRTCLLALPLLVPLALPACGGGKPASFPDREGVAQAEAAWCSMLGKVSGQGDAWESMAACKAGAPTASAAYLRAMTTCFEERVASFSKKDMPDSRQISAGCEDEIVFKLPAEDAAGRSIMKARCDRMERCEKVAPAECAAASEKLEASQRALFTSSFNASALQEVEACLASSSCTDDEEAARNACYAPVRERLLWFPL